MGVLINPEVVACRGREAPCLGRNRVVVARCRYCEGCGQPRCHASGKRLLAERGLGPIVGDAAGPGKEGGIGLRLCEGLGCRSLEVEQDHEDLVGHRGRHRSRRRRFRHHGDRIGRDARSGAVTRYRNAHAGLELHWGDRQVDLALGAVVLLQHPQEAARASFEIVSVTELDLALDRDLRRRGGRLRPRQGFLALDDHRTALHVPGRRDPRPLLHDDSVGKLEPRYRAVVAHKRVNPLAARAVQVDEVEDRQPTRERYRRAVGQARRLRALLVSVDVMCVGAGPEAQRQRRDGRPRGRATQCKTTIHYCLPEHAGPCNPYAICIDGRAPVLTGQR